MIDDSSYVLDVGCGYGGFLMYLARRFGCGGEGLDLSEERIGFAREKLSGEPGLRLRFRHGSVTEMPYDAGAFTHVVSQDALFLVPDKPRSHAEIYRVLAPGGILAFCDFLRPKPAVSERAREHIYDPVGWEHGYSLSGYAGALAARGFEVLLARDLGTHLRQTYRVLGRSATARAKTASGQARDWLLGFAQSCSEIQAAVDDGEFGWGVFVARKGKVSPA